MYVIRNHVPQPVADARTFPHGSRPPARKPAWVTGVVMLEQ